MVENDEFAHLGVEFWLRSEAKDFILALGCKSPNVRFNAAQALYHPFLVPNSRNRLELTRLKRYLENSTEARDSTPEESDQNATSLEPADATSPSISRTGFAPVQFGRKIKFRNHHTFLNLRTSFQAAL